MITSTGVVVVVVVMKMVVVMVVVVEMVMEMKVMMTPNYLFYFVFLQQLLLPYGEGFQQPVL